MKLLTVRPGARAVLKTRSIVFCRLFPAEVERKFNSWLLNFFGCNLMTNWLQRGGEMRRGIKVVVIWILQ